MGHVADALIGQIRSVPHRVEPSRVAAVVREYLSSYDSGDVEQRVSLFADRLRFEDPAGVIRATDRSSLRAFYDELDKNAYHLKFSQDRLVVSGDSALVDATVDVAIGDLGTASIDLSLVVDLDGDGRIVTFRTFFDEGSVSE